ncbi:nucleotidyltransferase family protein [Nocardia brasiliensis]|uniref:nucleotidyltransferase family protein n=1 Tax=Nocardia brasiliensis TaxID=37326 RepID=UPI003D78CEE8
MARASSAYASAWSNGCRSTQGNAVVDTWTGGSGGWRPAQRGILATVTRFNRGLCAVVLAAGRGKRLRPLTHLVPKPLCPVGNTTLLDRVLGEATEFGLSGPMDVTGQCPI